jgi:hypothetical protein
MSVTTLPRFLFANELGNGQRNYLLVAAALTVIVWCVAAVTAIPLVSTVLGNTAAVLPLLVATLQSAYWAVRWRARVLNPIEPPQRGRRRPLGDQGVESLCLVGLSVALLMIRHFCLRDIG